MAKVFKRAMLLQLAHQKNAPTLEPKITLAIVVPTKRRRRTHVMRPKNYVHVCAKNHKLSQEPTSGIY